MVVTSEALNTVAVSNCVDCWSIDNTDPFPSHQLTTQLNSSRVLCYLFFTKLADIVDRIILLCATCFVTLEHHWTQHTVLWIGCVVLLKAINNWVGFLLWYVDCYSCIVWFSISLSVCLEWRAIDDWHTAWMSRCVWNNSVSVQAGSHCGSVISLSVWQCHYESL